MKKRLIAYFPGCSLHGMAREYDISTRAICRELGLDLVEVPDWNCCGATSAHSLDQKLSLLLPARNLKIIEQQDLDVIIPCAACFSRTKMCAHVLENDQVKKTDIERELDFKFKRKINIYHLVELLAEEVGLDEIKKHVRRPLKNLKALCYYGCLLVRPHKITQFDDQENPQFLDQLMQAIGISTIDWPYKTECCGASLSLSRGKLVEKLVGDMIDWKQDSEAKAIVTACPLCQANLEMRQAKGQSTPVFYFTELLGLAFGLKEVEGTLNNHLISTRKLVDELKEISGTQESMNTELEQS